MHLKKIMMKKHVVYNMDTKCVWECQGEKKNLAKGRAGENNCSTTLVLTALIIMVATNVRVP
jgi:hypothetical protein